MDWAKGYTSRYSLHILDEMTWRDIAELEMAECEIDCDADGMMQSAEISVPALYDDGTGDTARERWARVYMDVSQEGESARYALFTGLVSAPERNYKNGVVSYKMTCYSVLKPPNDIYLQRGYYAPVATSGAELIAQLLSTSPAPITAAGGSPQLKTAIVAEDDETALTMARKIADAIDWRIRIDGMGAVSIEPKPTDTVARFDALSADVITSEFTDTSDWYGCPNVFRAVMDGEVAVARDETSDRLSIAARGREIWQQETDVELSDGETLAQYAQRKLAEAQKSARKLSYDRRYYDGVGVGDRVRISYPADGIDGVFEVTSQTIQAGTPCKVSEEVSEV
jgi:hypothetical protein